MFDSTQLRWVVIEHPGGMKSKPVLQQTGLLMDWHAVPTHTIKVDDKGNVLTEGEGDD